MVVKEIQITSRELNFPTVSFMILLLQLPLLLHDGGFARPGERGRLSRPGGGQHLQGHSLGGPLAFSLASDAGGEKKEDKTIGALTIRTISN